MIKIEQLYAFRFSLSIYIIYFERVLPAYLIGGKFSGGKFSILVPSGNSFNGKLPTGKFTTNKVVLYHDILLHIKRHDIYIYTVKPRFTVPRFTVSPDLPGLISFPQNFFSEISQDEGSLDHVPKLLIT
jgi:hypothetical protein